MTSQRDQNGYKVSEIRGCRDSKRLGQKYSKNPHIRTYSYGISLINFLLTIHYLAKCCIREVK